MKLREHLDQEEISESEFAKLIGTSQAAVNRYCRGRIPRPKIMDKIVKKTGGKVTPGDFYASKVA